MELANPLLCMGVFMHMCVVSRMHKQQSHLETQ